MHPFSLASLEANREIARRIAGGITPDQRIKTIQGAGGDISSGIDLEAEAIFVEHLSSFGQIHSEESGVIGVGSHTILLDPIDGSSNILSHFPYYGTSAALIDPNGVTIAACVCNLAAGEIFFKELSSSAQHGDLFSDTFTPYVMEGNPEIGIFERAYAHEDIIRSLGEQKLKFRSPGAVALSLIYSIQARFFLYVGQYRAYDFAAGLAFLEGMEVEATDEYVIAAHDREMVERIKLIVD